MYSKNKLFGQGAVEYLVIIGVISVIALISVSITFVALNPVDLKEKATQQELKELSLSIIETSFNYSTESFLLRLKNNYSSRVTIKNIKIGDINSNFDQNLLSGANHNFLISSSEICENNEIIKDLLITFESKYGLEHVQQVKGVSFSCNEFDLREVLRFFYIPQRDLVDGIISNINILGDGNYSFSFNSGSGDAVAYYSFDSSNGSMVEDMVGSADGTLLNGVSVGSGGQFGSNALIITDNYHAFDIPDFSSSQITIMGWYYFESTGGGGWNTIFCREGGTYHHLLINDDSREIGFYNNGFYSSGTTLTLGTLYHFAVVKDGYNEKIYMNGNLIMNSDSSFNNSSYPFGIIGNYVNGADQGARGWIDEVKIYNRVLSESEVEAEYNSTGTSEDSNYVTKLIDTKKSSSLFDSVIVNTNGLRHGEEIDPEIEPSLANGLVGLWHLNEESGEIAFDSSGNGYDGTRSSESGAGGITETIDGDYTIYTFNSSGTFTIDNDITAEVLVVAGGGGGGNGELSAGGDGAGGGGGGGLIYNNNYSISAGSYNVVVGDGGAGATSLNAKGLNGGNSVFNTLTAIGGGGGGSDGHSTTINNGANGGSGGGCGSKHDQATTGGSGTSGQGNNGGSCDSSISNRGGGGGGGAGGVGENQPLSSTGEAGDGGIGVPISITGQEVYYAGGGGGGAGYPVYDDGFSGGTGGLGGGGSGVVGAWGADGTGGNGVDGTGGGGGGGAAGDYDGGTGGSGIVIIKFLTSQGTATVSSGLSSSSGSSSGLWGTNAGNFNGSSDYISGSDFEFPSGASPRTVSFWAYPTLVNGAYHIVLFYGTYSSNAMTEIGIYNDNRWFVSQHGAAIFGNTVAANKWTFVTAVYDGSDWYFYENGVLINSGEMTTNTVLNQFNIGAENGGSNFFKGRLDEVAIWDRAFSASEVSDLFNKGVAKIGVQARACASEDCSAEWSSGQYGSNEFKYFSLPRSKYFQFKITSELIPFEAKLVIPESCVSPYGADYWDGCYSYFHDSSSCNAYSNHNGSCYWYEYGECYGDMWGHCYNQYDEYSCSSQNGCYWNYPYCYGDMWGYCYYNFYDESSCNSQNGCSWYNYYSGCEGDMWGYCYNNYTDEASCNAVSECSWGGDGCYSQTECYYFDYDSCQSHSQMCYWYEYGECSPTIDCSSQDQSSCYNYGGCYLEGNYCSASTDCYYNYDRSSCESYPACSFNDYSYCEGGFRCEDQLNEGSSSCTVFGSGCNYTAPVSTDYLSYFYNATPKLVDINILYYN